MTRKHRVVVQIDEDDRNEDIELAARMGMQVVDSRTLQTHINPESRDAFCSPRHFHFDCVGTSRNAFTRAEMTMLMDQLLLQQSNCSLLRFSAKRECPLAFLCNLLVTEVDKRMALLQTKLIEIKLEYYDVRKYDVVNLLGKADRHTTIKSKRVQRPSLTFSTTLELLKWLQGKYLNLFAMGQGQENFDIQFTYGDTRQHVFQAKLSLIIMYMSKMDGDTKTCLRNFLENMSNRRKLKNLMVTDCMKEIFNGTETWYSWFIFNVPTSTGVGTTIDDMLKLANAAYAGVKAMDAGQEDNLSANFEMESLLSLPLLANRHRSVDSVNTTAAPQPHLSMASEINKSSIVLNPKRTTTTNRYPLKDLGDINYWYTKMDDRVANVMKHMEAYYTTKFKARIAKLCYDVKSMMRPKSMSTEPPKPFDLEEMHTCYSSYRAAMVQFLRLVRDIQRSVYADLLQVHVRSKQTELRQHATVLKLKQLQKCQSCLADTIQEETTMLHDTMITRSFSALTTENASKGPKKFKSKRTDSNVATENRSAVKTIAEVTSSVASDKKSATEHESPAAISKKTFTELGNAATIDKTTSTELESAAKIDQKTSAERGSLIKLGKKLSKDRASFSVLGKRTSVERVNLVSIIKKSALSKAISMLDGNKTMKVKS